MRVLQTILIIIFLAVAVLSGCDDNRIKSVVSDYKTDQSKDTNLADANSNSALLKLKKDKIRRRINRNMDAVKLRLKSLEDSTSSAGKNISSNAQRVSEQLRIDLVRLKEDLENRLSALDAEDNISEAGSSAAKGLEKIEDELSQIGEEVAEWVENNTD